MTEREAAVITGFTGIMIGSASNFHKYVEEKFNRSVFTHEMASDDFWENMKRLTREDFIKLNYSIIEDL